MMNVLEAIGVFAFAISGAVVAMEEKFDLFGIYVMAAITAMGGGILRDAILNQGLPIFFTSQWTWGVIFIGASLAIFLRKNILNKMVFVIIDAIGLAAFAISAASTMMEQGQNKMVILFAACVTGVGGGMIRDIMVNRKPAIFCYDIYAVAAVVGGLTFIYLCNIWGTGVAVVVSWIFTFVIRMLCYLKNINLPKIRVKMSVEL
ncbi:MAG TPA: trimeric intracellular cation channel family protein [Candidatus Scybalomonas excrementigallinarum]|nr:trimeric intracellular cation channel family protein [Candidatus Scybalomonas excrementigallinarum]